MASGVSRNKVGSYLGTGSAQDIELDKVGFKPKRIVIARATTGIDLAEFYGDDTMADDSFFLTTGTTGVRTLVAANGITLTDTGFTVGTHASINNSGDKYIYFCEE